MRLSDPSFVREEYADESRLAARKRAHERGEGPDAREIVFAAVRDAQPGRVLDVGCGEGELARVLRPGGRLVAATNGPDHLRELYELLEADPLDLRFNSANGEAALGRHFSWVMRIDAHGWLVFPGAAEAQAYVDSMLHLSGKVVPDVEGPIRARRTPSVFVCTK